MYVTRQARPAARGSGPEAGHELTELSLPIGLLGRAEDQKPADHDFRRLLNAQCFNSCTCVTQAFATFEFS